MTSSVTTDPVSGWPEWLKPDRFGYYHPADEGQVSAIVRFAKTRGLQVRVSGSRHSVIGAIQTDNFQEFPDSRSGINLMLDQLRQVEIDPASKTVRVGAGCSLGYNPYDLTLSSTLGNSLFYQLDQQGLAFPDMGGIILQTVAGFLSTGSSGGSIKYGVGEQLLQIRLIDGNGDARTLTRASGSDEFFAAGVSFGLLGIITEATFQCIDKFYIQGTEVTTTVADVPIDLFGPGTATKPSLARYLSDTEYARLEWWPQKGVEKVTVWQAARLTAAQAQEHFVGTSFQPNPYEAIPWFTIPVVNLPTPLPSELGISTILTLVGNWPIWFRTFFRNAYSEEGLRQGLATGIGWLFQLLTRVAFPDHGSPVHSDVEAKLDALVPAANDAQIRQTLTDTLMTIVRQYGLPALLITVKEITRELAKNATLMDFCQDIVERLFEPVIIPMLFNPFITVNSDDPKRFWDVWWHGIPMDNQFDYDIMPVGLMEIWLPAERSQEVMEALDELYRQNGLAATGTYCVEIYAAKKSDFWLSPSYPGDSIRVDLFWFGRNRSDPRFSYFPQFWALFYEKGLPFRFHWGKYLPTPSAGVAGDNTPTLPEYLKAQYAHWDDFLRIRKQFDPNGVFLTQYWRDHLGITPA